MMSIWTSYKCNISLEISKIAKPCWILDRYSWLRNDHCPPINFDGHHCQLSSSITVAECCECRFFTCPMSYLDRNIGMGAWGHECCCEFQFFTCNNRSM
jgi:hypothetical protein